MASEHYKKDLEGCCIATSNNLKELLTTCQDPVEAIKQFQAVNSIQLSSLKPVLKFVPFLSGNVRRSEYYEMVNNDLTEKVMAKLKNLGEKRTPENVLKLEQLERSFKLYRVPTLRPIVLETLRLLPKVADRYLKLIVCDKEFYESCAVTVRQQIWVKNDALFLEAVNPVIESYLEEKQKVLLAVERSPTNFFTRDTTKSRRQWKQIQELINMVCEKESLYIRLMELIRERYLSTGCQHYCSLKLELLMTAHDLNVEQAVKLDPCHDFAWCLDACLMQKHLDGQQTLKLKALLLETSRRGQNKVIADLGMIANDPHVVHFLCSMVVKVLKDIASSGAYLPRDHVPLHLLIKLLCLGAWYSQLKPEEFVDIDELPQQLVNPELITVFLPAFTTLISEDMLRLELRRIPDEICDELGQEKEVKEIPEVVLDFLKSDKVCALLWLHYTIDLFPAKRRIYDRSTIFRYLQALPDLTDTMAIKDPWIHFLLHRLIQTNPVDALISDETISSVLIDSLLVAGLKVSHSLKFHLLRLCIQLKSTIQEATFESAREKLLEICEQMSAAESNSPLDEMFMRELEKFNTSIVPQVREVEEEGEIPSLPPNASTTDELLG